ncbi:PspC domain-containing protein [Sphingomonas sp. BIUV-7]|uniref:PspC domain-containing protein n=1 Tax=Sphingomonas natans TaxID=3063330 RepID=A0ABT8Y8H2_9SPHN|nr:PspC domain-containing protein [Sphingomonas sp. BIUV-7]MDO6413985.1 PspC domain-containing protein [Sphingomonas sp. BIUV-7]
MATLPNQAADPRIAHHRDNLLGVCAALGEITRLDPLLFRIAFVFAMLGLSFEMTIGVYLIAALAFFVARR